MTYQVLATTNAKQIAAELHLFGKRYRKVLNYSLNDVAFAVRKDEREVMEQQLRGPFGQARPTPYTLRALNVKKSSLFALKSAVFVNPNNHYLPRVVEGGIRKPKRKYIFIPARVFRRNQYGNVTKATRLKLLNDPKAFRIKKGERLLVLKRKGKKIEYLGQYRDQTVYRFGGYWTFYQSAVTSFDRQFPAIFHARYLASFR